MELSLKNNIAILGLNLNVYGYWKNFYSDGIKIKSTVYFLVFLSLPLHMRTAVTFSGIDGSVERTTTFSSVKVPQPNATNRDMNLTSFLPSPLAIAMIDSAFFIMIDLNDIGHV